MFISDPTDPHSQDKDWAAIQEARRLAEQRTERDRYLMQERGKKIYLGNEGPEKHPGFTAALPFYLFWCPECEHWAKDYPHGFEDRARLICPNCDASYSCVSLKVKFLVFWEMLFMAFSALAFRLGWKVGVFAPAKEEKK